MLQEAVERSVNLSCTCDRLSFRLSFSVLFSV